MKLEPINPATEVIIAEQLGRAPRGLAGIAYRCPSGHPGVVATLPRLPDGTPFPTTFYLTCPGAVLACSTLESQGVMTELNQRLAADSDFAASYEQAHLAYLADRASLGDVPQIAGFSAGGMPNRVKCLHALLAHTLAAGPRINPVGDIVLSRIGAFCQENKHE